jgi:hypothetical protein
VSFLAPNLHILHLFGSIDGCGLSETFEALRSFFFLLPEHIFLAFNFLVLTAVAELNINTCTILSALVPLP